jgi:hypothetical protein
VKDYAANPLPRHGSSSRRRDLDCRCIACSRRRKADDNYVVRWPLPALLSHFGSEKISEWFSEAQIEEWSRDGLSDDEADVAAIILGAFPHEVWRGWVTAGLDYKDA